MLICRLNKGESVPTKIDGLKGAITELSGFPLFSGFDQNTISNLCLGGEIRVNKHRDLLFQFGLPAQQFGIVLSGAYKLSRVTPSGEESVIYFALPGDVVAALIMPQQGATYPVTVRAMGNSRILLLKKDIYLQSWIKIPDLIIQIQCLLSTRMNRFQNQKVMQRAPLASKVASLLLQLVTKDSNKDELEVPLPLTRKEIADNLGVAVESVIRVMSDWDKQGYIMTLDQNIVILKPDQLVHQLEYEAN